MFGVWLAREGIASEAELTARREEIRSEASEAVASAREAPYPDGSDVDMHVFQEAS